MYTRENSIGFAINQAARLMVKSMRAQLDIKDLQPAFLPVILWLLERDGRLQSELTKLAAIEQPSMAEIIKRMEMTGFVRRRPDPDDKRRKTIHLTAKARQAASKIHAWLDTSNRKVSAGISPDELSNCLRVLTRIIENLEQQNEAERD